MAHLFKNKTIKTELEDYEIPDLEDKIEKIKAWYEAYNNKTLGKKTESQCEQAFNQNFFIEILGYESFPNEIYTIDPKGTADASSQKADAVLGYFTQDKKKVTAVVEIKDVNTSLDKSQQRAGNLSPIQQAFKYKPQYKDCAFVIATNFYEIRLFRDNQLDYESFTLDKLVDSKDNYFEFRKFYYLLNAENFVIKHGKSNTERLLSEIRIEQEKITKKFYQDYKHLRQELIHDISKNNKNIDFNTVIEKAQKIIDRVVFISFCEDLDLIPENKLQEVVHFADKRGLPMPIWDLMKGFFNAIDKGSQKLDIPHGYNGELFREDAILNNLSIDDDICKKFVELGRYDFSEDLSVNILGHIFEQSISDIEELKNMAEEKETDKKKSKRKKEGIFYTPDYIVDYIVKNSLGAYLEEKEKEIFKKYNLKEDIKDKNYEKRALLAYQDYQEVLNNIKVLDPACGSGAFLVKVFDYLLAENKRISNIIVELAGGKIDMFTTEIFIKELLENNIYGVDLNPESVEITKLSLWLKTARKGKKLVNLAKNIKCGNSLIDDIEVAGERAFDWNKEFPEIMKDGGFDVIVGNPPYVRQELLKEISPYLEKNFESYAGKADLYVYFFEKAINLLKKGGYLSYICSGKFFEANYGKQLLEFLGRNIVIKEIIDFKDLEVFPGVSAYPIIMKAKKNQISKKDYFYYHNVSDLNFSDLSEKKSEQYTKINNCLFVENDFKLWSEEVVNLTKKLSDKGISLKDYCGLPIVGIKTGFNEGFVVKDAQTQLSKDYIFGKNIKRYMPVISKEKMIFPYLWNEDRYELVDINNYRSDEVILLQNKEKLEKRAIIKEGLSTGTKKWYEYQQINLKTNFDNKYIVYPNVSLGNNFTLSKNAIVDMTGFIIRSDDRYLLGILNSKVVEFLMSIMAISRRGGYLEYKVQYIEKIPIPNTSEANRKALIQKVNLIIELNKKLSEMVQKFIRLIRAEFGIDKISRKFEKFYSLNFEEFCSEVNLNKLNLSKKEELLEFFDKHKKELLKLKNEIDVTDSKIDKMVFDLYNISEDERNIILK